MTTEEKINEVWQTLSRDEAVEQMCNAIEDMLDRETPSVRSSDYTRLKKLISIIDRGE